MKNPIILNHEDTNTLNFTITMDDSVVQIKDTSSPHYKFTISEVNKKTNLSLGFDIIKKDQPNIFEVQLPNLSHIVEKNKEYKGKVEAFVENKYFVPMELKIIFSEPLIEESKTNITEDLPELFKAALFTENPILPKNFKPTPNNLKSKLKTMILESFKEIK